MKMLVLLLCPILASIVLQVDTFPSNETSSSLRSAITNGYNSPYRGFFVAVKVYNSGSSSYDRCGGSIIGNYHVLTAAHCVSKSPRKVVVEVGDFTKGRSPSGVAKYTVQYLRNSGFNPNSNPSNWRDDVALLYLKDKLSSKRIIPLCKSYYSKYSIAVCGLGKLSNGGSYASRLQEVQMSETSCNSGGKVCLQGSNRKSSCNADSGGPIYPLTNSGPVCLYSLVSTGNNCKGSTRGPRVSDYANWINKNW